MRRTRPSFNSRTSSNLIRMFLVMMLVSGVAFNVTAQETRFSKSADYFEFAASGASGRFSGALSWSHAARVSKRLPRVKLNYGLRFTSFVGANKYYVTAPSKYTSPVQSLGTIFSETIEANIDTVTTATAVTHALNVAIGIQYSITPKLEVGFNIDAVGFSFGPKRDFNIISSVFDPNQPPVVSGSPTRLNLLLTSDNDIGSLNSEFFARYWLSDKIGIRAGFTFLFSEYRLDRELSFDNGRIMNDRYRYKASMAMLGISYKAFNKN